MADLDDEPRDVRYWHLADLNAEAADFCLGVQTGLAEVVFQRSAMTQSGNHCSWIVREIQGDKPGTVGRLDFRQGARYNGGGS